MKKSMKVVTMCLAATMVLSTMSLGVFAAEEDIYSAEVFSMSVDETRARGFLIIDGDVCDLDGNMILDLTNGLTSGGCELDPEFRVIYPRKAGELNTFSARAINYIANGTFHLSSNAIGEEGRIIGTTFSPTSSQPNVYVKNTIDSPTSINVGVFNIGRNSVLTWTPEIMPGDYVVMCGGIIGENHQLKASAEGINGNAKILAHLTESSISMNVFAADVEFSDIDGHWAEETIIKFKDKNIISGYPDGTFKPDNSVTRAEFAKIITEAFDLQEKNPLEYEDVDQDGWYYPYLECSAKYIPVYPLPVSYESNIPYRDASNKDGNYFLPDTEAIRMHVAETLVEVKKDKEKINVELPVIQDIKAELEAKFKDADYVNLYPMHGKVPTNVQRMFEYTWLADKLDVMHGNTDGYFLPYGKITRAELVTAIDRLLKD